MDEDILLTLLTHKSSLVTKLVYYASDWELNIFNIDLLCLLNFEDCVYDSDCRSSSADASPTMHKHFLAWFTFFNLIDEKNSLINHVSKLSIGGWNTEIFPISKMSVLNLDHFTCSLVDDF